MRKPTIHLNGTSLEKLTEEWREVFYKADTLVKALGQVTVNQRDYYPQGMEEWGEAMAAHNKMCDWALAIYQESYEMFDYLATELDKKQAARV